MHFSSASTLWLMVGWEYVSATTTGCGVKQEKEFFASFFKPEIKAAP
jgi:hypothetical protein